LSSGGPIQYSSSAFHPAFQSG